MKLSVMDEHDCCCYGTCKNNNSAAVKELSTKNKKSISRIEQKKLDLFV
jgi:hypothetical protein